MQYSHIKTPTTLFPDNFCKPFDGLLVCVDMENMEDIEEINSKKAQTYIKDTLDFSWDGAIYWFPNGASEKFLQFSEQWFQENFESMESECDESISNCLMYSKTATGIAFVDTQVDMGSKIDELIEEFSKAYPEDYEKHKYIDDCHLVDNLKFGRNKDESLDSTLKFLVEEKFLTHNVFLWSDDIFLKKLNTDKPIVLTGTFSSTRDQIKNNLEYAGFTVANTITSNSWLWVGEAAGASKLTAAAKKGAQVSSIDEVMNIFYKANYPDELSHKRKF